MRTVEIAVIGGGAAGLAAACAAYEAGCKDILILEREDQLGGILNQCIHTGFGLHVFQEELTGPEYADRFVKKVLGYGIEVQLGTFVLDIKDHLIVAVNHHGMQKISCSSMILATGCRERPRGPLLMPGTRPAGILTAGNAQKMINRMGWLPGKKVVILGSGDIGLIMARRLTLEGAKVEAVLEILPYTSGLARNVAQCLDDFGIPLLLSHTIIELRGKKRVEGVTAAKVDARRNPISGSEIQFDCDTLLLSVGLIPENELARAAALEISSATKGAVVDQNFETSQKDIFMCGNALHVHDLVDHVTLESVKAGMSAAAAIRRAHRNEQGDIHLCDGPGVSGCVPQLLRGKPDRPLTLLFRPTGTYRNSRVLITCSGQEIAGVRKGILTPGEMAEITIQPDVIPDLAQEMQISVEAAL